MDQEAEYQVTTTPVLSGSPTPMSGMGMLTLDVIERAEAAVAAVNRVKAICLKVTRHCDWKQFGDKAYLQATGCDKVAAQWGVSFTFPEGAVQRREEIRGEKSVVVFVAKCTAHFAGRTVDAIGVCDSEKQFYVGKTEPKPFEDRDFASMEKHAVTNAKNRALKAILGFDGIPWEEVQAALGANAGKVEAIEYKGKRQERAAPTVDEVSAKASMRKMLLEMSGGDTDGAVNILKELTTDPTGKYQPMTSVEKMSAKQAGYILNQRVKPAYDRWCQDQGDPMGPEPPREPGQEG